MKSFIMSIFLLSVALGNFFAAQVNHHIQPDSPIASVLKDYKKNPQDIMTYAGHDQKTGTSDDIIVHMKNEAIDEIQIPGKDIIDQARKAILAWSSNHEDTLPNTEEGQKLIQNLTDPWGQPLHYRLQNRYQCRISSKGPDKQPTTQWDVGTIIKLPEPVPEKKTTWVDSLRPEKDWLTKRKEQLAHKDANDDKDDKNYSYYAGGQDTLEGADYFWFFTKLMLVTAIIFIPFSIFYKPKTYLQE